MNNNVARYACKALASLLRDPNCVIEHLDLQENAIDDVAVKDLVGALAEEDSTVRELYLGWNRKISDAGWGEVATLLQGSSLTAFSTCELRRGNAFIDALSQNTTLKELELTSAGLTDDNIIALMNTIARNNNPMTHLDIRSNRSVTVSGIREVARYLRSPTCGLKSLKIELLSEDVLTLMADALSENCSLTHLTSGSNFSASAWIRFELALCDASSIESTYLSNHTLREIETRRSHSAQMPDSVATYLRFNGYYSSKMKIARLKIIKHHFSDSSFIMQPFTDMNVKVLPYAMTWMANLGSRYVEKSDLSRCYTFINNMSSCYEFGGPTERQHPVGRNKRRKKAR